MSKLVRANNFCLRRSKVLWLCVAAALVFSCAFVLKIESGGEGGTTLEQAVFQVFPFLPVAYAVFISLFLGVEYQDGTLRNKLISGHSKGTVYCSYLITATTGCFLILLAWAASIAVGSTKFGWFVAPTKTLLLFAVLILLLTVALSAILTMLCLLVPNRAVSAVAAILLAFGLIVISSAVYNALCEPATTSYAVATATGFDISEPQPNPNYISGSLRKIYQFIIDALPTGQAILLANQELERPVLSLCASIGIAVLVSAAGITAFKRKNLK